MHVWLEVNVFEWEIDKCVRVNAANDSKWIHKRPIDSQFRRPNCSRIEFSRKQTWIRSNLFKARPIDVLKQSFRANFIFLITSLRQVPLSWQYVCRRWHAVFGNAHQALFQVIYCNGWIELSLIRSMVLLTFWMSDSHSFAEGGQLRKCTMWSRAVPYKVIQWALFD